jgi:hypothetical protein
MRSPKPLPFGELTRGSPLFCQTSFTKSGLECRSHLTSTRPVPFERAPYLAALVASSCRIIATMTALAGSNQRCGASSILMRVPTCSWNGSSARLMAALEGGPFPSFRSQHIAGCGDVGRGQEAVTGRPRALHECHSALFQSSRPYAGSAARRRLPA